MVATLTASVIWVTVGAVALMWCYKQSSKSSDAHLPDTARQVFVGDDGTVVYGPWINVAAMGSAKELLPLADQVP